VREKTEDDSGEFSCSYADVIDKAVMQRTQDAIYKQELAIKVHQENYKG